MKELIVIIRPNKMTATKEALDTLGYPSMTVSPVLGRGKQRGIAGEVKITSESVLAAAANSGTGMKYIPKRLLNLIVQDEDVDLVVNTLIKINQTGQVGDGRIFICPIEDALRVRTGETGVRAII
ncbi:P-II family nitrogen regulator [Paenibacillus sp. YN15]|uniref:P-II family nitrogen regulator n=1 Tax=Paenibacillus sp. YN15 TaxID=1742774 RepID=UPI000DCBDC72|nr:P-II family nitrogen regulator [Paenibacillus sp. YN15]RAU97655.1 nitrogen fixation protein NifHD [Paenibacillus sp. YN15]